MIFVQSPLKRGYIKELLDGKTIEGVTYKFVKEEGMKLFFEFESELSQEQAAAVAKSVVKKSEFGSALYFTVGTSN